ncbi:outer membrane beta-barrel protein [Chitinophaga sp. S165]|uniref:outer membrane beta-barrel protein n=1 Tax=Chitinophaga sp. S165 TaxID=2135462 RepID=UPI000D71BDCF|nr:outer membrane beta-barrel protein [Chitinophaga sp. S165]PWV48856.1 outer membrane protein with beta-barrel domain [Chitinophaga sp. S165]
MQLLDDDMDELFRNAASDYPLNTGGGDWEAMRDRLQQADNNQSGTATGKLTDRWWFKPGTFSLITAFLLMTAVKDLSDGERLLAEDVANGVKANKEVTNGGQFIRGNDVKADSRDHQDANEHVVRQEELKVTKQYAGNRPTTGDSEQSTMNRKTGNSTVRASVTQDVPISSYPAARPGITAVSTTSLSIDGIRGIENKDPFPAVNIIHRNNSIRLPAAGNNVTGPVKKIKQGPGYLKTGLYYGLIASPDITTVKFQRASNVGYNVGLLAGYRFNKRLAVETGVIYERKYYYSEGKYFNKKNTPWDNDNMKILDVDGWCNMYEIPLNVRYTFATSSKSSWYVNGGISSYIMKKQGYNYNYEYYGAPGNRDWVYKHTTKDWFSNAHVGVGYERSAGVLGILRVEPYVKIPVKGIGVGELPVTSVGMNIGLTRPIRLK